MYHCLHVFMMLVIAVSQHSQVAINYLNSKSEWTLSFGVGGNLRCLTFETTSRSQEHGKGKNDRFVAQSLEREAVLIAEGDSSRLLYFVFSDRVESYSFTLDSALLHNHPDFVKIAEEPVPAAIEGKLSTSRDICNVNAPESKLNQFFSAWERNSGNFKIAKGGSMGCDRVSFRGTTLRKYKCQSKLSVCAVTFNGVAQPPFSLNVMPTLFGGQVVFVGTESERPDYYDKYLFLSLDQLSICFFIAFIYAFSFIALFSSAVCLVLLPLIN
jgi:hypothetical protein